MLTVFVSFVPFFVFFVLKKCRFGNLHFYSLVLSGTEIKPLKTTSPENPHTQNA